MATATKRRPRSGSKPGGRGGSSSTLGAARAKAARDRADRLAQKNRAEKERDQLRARHAAQRARWAATAGSAGKVMWRAGRATAAGARFLGGKCRETSAHAAPHVLRAARAAGWAPQAGWSDRMRQARTDARTDGFGSVHVDDWASGEHVDHRDVDAHLGQARTEVFGASATGWSDRPHSHTGTPPASAPGGRRLHSWWPPHRAEAAEFRRRVDAALAAARRPAPTAAVRPVIDGHLVPTPTPPAGVVLPFRPRPALPAPKEPRMSAPTDLSLSSLEELLNPDWSQASFQTDVPDWLDKVHAVLTRFSVCFQELAELGVHVELPAQVRDGLALISDGLDELPPAAQRVAGECRAMFESYEIPRLA